MIRATFRLTLFALWMLLVVPVALTLRALNMRRADAKVVQWAFGGVRWIVGVKLKVTGVPCGAPCLMVSNHISYLDVYALGGVVPMRFTPKTEVKRWPIIGVLTTLSGAIYVDRDPRAVKAQFARIHAALTDGGPPIMLFPEGTTGGGMKLLPFKSSLMGVAEGLDVPVQPVSITYTHISGLPITHSDWLRLAWIGDMDLVPHLIDILSQTEVRCRVHFHPPMTTAGMDRKMLAKQAQTIVDDGRWALRAESL